MIGFNESIHVGVVEDDPQVIAYLVRAFEDEEAQRGGFKFKVSVTDDVAVANAWIVKDEIDIWIVDLNLPSTVGSKPTWTTGQKLVREIHSTSSAAIVIYTSESLGERANELLAIGADDFIRKAEVGFELSDNLRDMQSYLRAKVVSVWRRTKLTRPRFKSLSLHSERKFRLGDLMFNISSRHLQGRDQVVKLTVNEHAVLRHLCVSSNNSINRSEFLAFVAGQENESEDVRLKNLVYRLRQKLGAAVELSSTFEGYKLNSISELL